MERGRDRDERTAPRHGRRGGPPAPADGGHPVVDMEKRYIRKDGNAVWARVTANIIRDESGRPLRDTAMIQDINARKQAEQILQASKDRLQLALSPARVVAVRSAPPRVLGGYALSGDFRFCRE
jgi:PAS domain-containing protein